jgi:hypothetical protein
MNLIANSGIHLYTTSVEFNSNDNLKMFFHEWFDKEDEQLKLEIAHKFTEDGEDIWVRKIDLSKLGYLQLKDEEKDGKLMRKGSLIANWNDIEEDFRNEGFNLVSDGDSTCYEVNFNKCFWDKFENEWLPLPFFALNRNNNSDFGPTNWCRVKLVPDSHGSQNKKYSVLLAFDTRTKYEDEDFEDEDLMETPVFSSEVDRFKKYSLCNNDFSILDFFSQQNNCEWVDEYLLKLFHGVNNINILKIKQHKLSYLAQYVFIIAYLKQLNILPIVTLYSEKNVAHGNVDLVVDIGNSRTCGILFDESDFTKVELLSLQNFTNPLTNGSINRVYEPFEMRLAFREADFGGSIIPGSQQFIFPSLVRLGKEANELIHNATNLNTGVEKVTTFSSPKRYLWDNKPQQNEWEFVTLKEEESKYIWIKGISEHLNADGSLNKDGKGGPTTQYSRRALMTFCFLEILAQAQMQVNSAGFHEKWGNVSLPRKVNRIIITCPTAMSKIEQISLRECAQDAAEIMERFYAGINWQSRYKTRSPKLIEVIPSVRNLSNVNEDREWTYDEATCSQFVYLYAEIKERYLNNSKQYFEFYGKFRKDLGDYKRKSITIGSVDIGAGTTDLMIAAYTYDEGVQYNLKPHPLFWESFYVAGDDLLKVLVQQLVIEGEYAALQMQQKKTGQSNGARLLLDYFGKDNARQSMFDRQMRSEFNLQVSIPVVQYYLNLLKEERIENATYLFSDIFSLNPPTKALSNHFRKHFGIEIDSLKWTFDREVISKIITRTFDALIGKISTVLSYYGCDIVLLSGRPASLKPLPELFMKYCPVPPNRLITLNNYRVGTWYPFQNGNGYFSDAKSIVAVGAMIGDYVSKRGVLNGFSMNLSELGKKMLPTSEYFAVTENALPFITPEINNAKIDVGQFPFRIWCRQLNSPQYPTRPIYLLDFNRERIETNISKKHANEFWDKNQLKFAVDREIEQLQLASPYSFTIVRDNYLDDRESLRIESIENRHKDDIPTSYFTLQIQSMSENGKYWLDSGEFSNLSISHV